MTNCPKVYKNLQCESFGDKKKITSQMLRQFCKNDAYLYDQIMKLWDMTDPESRKRFYPPTFMDNSKSYGIQCYALKDFEKERYDYLDYVYRFSKVTTYEYRLNFNSNDDNPNDNCVDESYKIIYDDTLVNTDGTYTEKKLERVSDGLNITFRPEETTGSFHKAATYQTVAGTTATPSVPEVLGEAKKDAYCYGPYKNCHCNSFWYAGFNRSKNYNIKSKWNKNQDTYDIPSVCRAQTFTAENNGKITKVSLMMQGDSSAKSPCIVEIRTTKNGKPTTKVLARAEKKFTHSTGAMTAFSFKTKAEVEKGKKYAIVVRAPLNNFGKTYRWGGWAHTCFSNMKKEAYYKGDAYLSEDNGKTWIHYGKNKDGKSYGAHWYDWGIAEKPIDFAFEVFVAPIKQKAIEGKPSQKASKKLLKKAYDVNFKYYKKGTYYLEFHPILCNPINKVTISPGYTNGNYSKNNYVWQILEPSTHTWKDMTRIEGDDFEYEFEEQGKYHYVKVRLKFTLDKDIADDNNVSSDERLAYTSNNITVDTVPYFKNARIIIDCNHPTRAYLRGEYYNPDRTNMLGANIWSEVYAKTAPMNNGYVEIDIIHKKQVSEHIKFYRIDNPDLVDYYIYYMKHYKNNYSYEYGINDSISSIILNDCDDTSEFVEYLGKQLTPVFLLPDDNTELQFFNTTGKPYVQLPNIPAYPIGNCEINIENPKIDLDVNSSIENLSTYGFTYNIGKDIKNTLKEITISYYVLNDEAAEYDENGYLANDLDCLERIEEVLVLDEDKTFAQDSDYLTDGGQVKESTFTNSYFDYNISPDGKKIIFNRQSNTIKNIFNINASTNKISFRSNFDIYEWNENSHADIITQENVDVFDVDVHIKLHEKSLTEFYDYEIDYDTGIVEFFTDVPECDMTFTYNPLWIRGLSQADFPLKMDLWTEEYKIGVGYNQNMDEIGGVYKQYYDMYDDQYDGEFFYPTNINPKSNRPTDKLYYSFKTSVPPRDNIRKLILNANDDEGGVELIEDTHFYVDYITNEVVLTYPNLQNGDTLTIKYTPNLTDTGLAIAYRLRRPTYDNQENMLVDDSGNVRWNTPQYQGMVDDVYILGNYFTYRT